MDYRANTRKLGLVQRFRRFLNGLGGKHRCCYCGRSFFRFSKFRGGWDSFSRYLRDVKWTGSDFDHFWCPFCKCHDRERHLLLFFDRLDLWKKFEGASVLHVAPEKGLGLRIEKCHPANYVRGDLFPSREGVGKLVVTQIQFPDASFDWVICNHVLEHVPDDRKALSELYRVLKPGGIAILQTPFAAGLSQTRENEPSVDTDAKRIEFYGQEDHVRLYGTDLFDRIRAAGFQLTLQSHAEKLPDHDALRYGVNPDEPLFLCRKLPVGEETV